LASASWWHKITNAYQQTRSGRGQPLEAPQLATVAQGMIQKIITADLAPASGRQDHTISRP
jgi:hypothetical protein